MRPACRRRCSWRRAWTRCARVFQTLNPRVLVHSTVCAQAGLFVAAGVDKVRLTGGEPTLRRDLPALVAALAALPGLRAVGLTTNGLTLARQLPELRDAGAPRWSLPLWHRAYSGTPHVAVSFEILHVPPSACLEVVWSDYRLQ